MTSMMKDVSARVLPCGTLDIPAVNIHLTRSCNLRCRFCFATFKDRAERVSIPDWKLIITRLAVAGVEKINFAGGEPTLVDGLGDLLRHSKALGLTTSIVSNGFGVARLLEDRAECLDWIGLSLDSSIESVQKELGRGSGDHVARTVEVARLCHQHRCRLKLNTVVTALNWAEDMSTVVDLINPERWKALQVLSVRGQNDGSVDDLLISEDQFRHFVDHHRQLGLEPVAEDNEAMTESYIMVDPMGHFFDNTDGRQNYSEHSILQVGVAAALCDVAYDPAKFERRGGRYDWTQRSTGDLDVGGYEHE